MRCGTESSVQKTARRDEAMIKDANIAEAEIGSTEWKDIELDERFAGLKGGGALAVELSEDRKSIFWRTASDGKLYCVDSVDILSPRSR